MMCNGHATVMQRLATCSDDSGAALCSSMRFATADWCLRDYWLPTTGYRRVFILLPTLHSYRRIIPTHLLDVFSTDPRSPHHAASSLYCRPPVYSPQPTHRLSLGLSHHPTLISSSLLFPSSLISTGISTRLLISTRHLYSTLSPHLHPSSLIDASGRRAASLLYASSPFRYPSPSPLLISATRHSSPHRHG
jgi:hypothetical protein